MKKKKILMFGILILLAVLALYYKPIPIVDAKMESDSAIITYARSVNGEAINDTIELNGDELKQLQEILNKYNCHRTLTSLWKIEEVNSDSVVLSIFFDAQHMIHYTGAEEVYVDWHRYKLGYFGVEKGKQLLEELETFLGI